MKFTNVQVMIILVVSLLCFCSVFGALLLISSSIGDSYTPTATQQEFFFVTEIPPVATIIIDTPVSTPTYTLQPTFTDTLNPTVTNTPPPTDAPVPTSTKVLCDPSYPTVCIAPFPPDLNCGDIPYKNFVVLQPDPHKFDKDKNGLGCEK